MCNLYQPNPFLSLISLIGMLFMIVIFIMTFIPALEYEQDVPSPNIGRFVIILLIFAMYQGVI